MNPLLSAAEVSAYLQVPIRTLHRWRHRRTGPPAIRVGRYLRYRQEDVEAWLTKQQSEQRSPPTSATSLAE